MTLTTSRINKIMNFIDANTARVNNAKKLFTINEGELLPFVLTALRSELSEKAFMRASKRVAPINVLPKIVDKLSTLYSNEVSRRETSGISSNQELVEYYTNILNMDPKMLCSQQQFNVSKYAALEPYIDRDTDSEFDMPKLRVLPAHTFLVYSDDLMDPTKVTAFIKILGQFLKETGELLPNGMPEEKTVTVYMIYDKDNIIAIDSDREVRLDFMQGNEEGINPFGVIPFIYINKNEFNLLPNPDTDTLPMSILIPLLLTDLNYATQFMSHSIVYVIDADVDHLSGNPDAVWHIKSEMKEDGSEAKADIGSIKPEVDIDKVLKLIETELRMWLDTRNIKASSIGNLEVSNAASGIAKMIDESDTSEARRSQEGLFKQVEKEFWKLIGIMHNTWLENGDNIEDKRRVVDSLEVKVNFQDQEVVVDTEKKLREISMKLAEKLTSHRRAIADANPNLDETGVDELMAEIKAEQDEQFILTMPEGLGLPQNEEQDLGDIPSDTNDDSDIG
jgi:hypothetical protein